MDFVTFLRAAAERTREGAAAINPCADADDKIKAAVLLRAAEWDAVADWNADAVKSLTIMLDWMHAWLEDKDPTMTAEGLADLNFVRETLRRGCTNMAVQPDEEARRSGHLHAVQLFLHRLGFHGPNWHPFWDFGNVSVECSVCGARRMVPFEDVGSIPRASIAPGPTFQK